MAATWPPRQILCCTLRNRGRATRPMRACALARARVHVTRRQQDARAIAEASSGMPCFRGRPSPSPLACLHALPGRQHGRRRISGQIFVIGARLDRPVSRSEQQQNSAKLARRPHEAGHFEPLRAGIGLDARRAGPGEQLRRWAVAGAHRGVGGLPPPPRLAGGRPALVRRPTFRPTGRPTDRWYLGVDRRAGMSGTGARGSWEGRTGSWAQGSHRSRPPCLPSAGSELNLLSDLVWGSRSIYARLWWTCAGGTAYELKSARLVALSPLLFCPFAFAPLSEPTGTARLEHPAGLRCAPPFHSADRAWARVG